MTDLFSALTSLLTEERRLLEALVALSEDENAALVAVDHDAFLGSVREQDALLTRLGDLERTRVDAATALAKAAGAPDGASLLEICQALPADLATEGRRIHDAIRDLTQRLGRLNRENEVLIRQALQQTQHSIALLAGITEREDRKNTYGPPGQPRGGRKPSVLDKRA